MKKFKKILALALAAVMVLAMSTTVFATEAGEEGGAASTTGTITITLPTTEIAPTKAVTYKIYKVFDATVSATDNTKISYTLCAGDTLSDAMIAAGFSVDAAGNVSFDTNKTMATDGTPTDTAIAAVAAYVTEADLVDTVTSAVGDASVTSKALPYGYYYITTSTGSAVTINSNNKNVTVNDKNVIPPVVKSAGTQYDAASLKAIAAVGTDQPFTAVITKTHGAINLVFEDTMTNLTYNEDVDITVSAGTAPTAAQAVVETTATGFKVTFDNAYIAGLADGTKITLNYSGKVTSDALSVNPATNKATLTSGDGNTYNSEEVDVYNAKFTVTKQDGDKQPLAGAGFVIKNADGKYYKLTAATATAPASITWYTLASGETLADAIAAGKVDEHVSNAQGEVPAFTGLADGTYTLVESTTPAGYNSVTDSTFTIAANDYTQANLEQEATVVNQAGTVLPSTGGMGTTILYIVGGVVVAAALVLLITKRRMRREDY